MLYNIIVNLFIREATRLDPSHLLAQMNYALVQLNRGFSSDVSRCFKHIIPRLVEVPMTPLQDVLLQLVSDYYAVLQSGTEHWHKLEKVKYSFKKT